MVAQSLAEMEDTMTTPLCLPGRMLNALVVVVLTAFLTPLTARAAAINYCVYDPLGNQGDMFAIAKDYQIAAARWGVNLTLHPYSSEPVAVEDFKAGQCDMIDLTGLRARSFNLFTGTLDAPGAIEDYSEMRLAVALLNSPKLANEMISGNYETVGVLPVGAAYAFVKDRRMTTIGKFAGKKVAVMSFDPTEAIMAEQFGMQPVMSDITDMGPKFNNGMVDVEIAPALAYQPFELYRGLGHNGGIIRRAILQVSMQLMIRRDKFPAGFGQMSRDYVQTTADHAFGIIHNVENGIDARFWMHISRAERNEYYATVRTARARLAKEGFYDKRMLNILKRVRCKSVPDDAECSEGDE